jgi:hypothetical protein
MNERIRELAEQAWDSLIDEMDDVVSEDGRLNSDFLHAYTQRFAELIVRECISELEKIKRSGVPTPIQSGLNLGVVSLKEHFGVK